MTATEWFYKGIGKDIKDGYFIEIGVMNGKTQNTTKVLEFKGWKGFGAFKTGKIGLQDHDDKVSFRNIKIKVL